MCLTPVFIFNDPATPEIYTLSLHDALPIYPRAAPGQRAAAAVGAPGRADELDRPPQQGPRALPRGGPAKIGRAHVLNSSHANISYAVFCLKKKKNTKHHDHK